MTFVLDASVILKLIIVEREEDQQIALGVIKNFQEGKAEILLPSFWVFEVGNTLMKKGGDYESLYVFVLDIGFPTHEFDSSELIEIGKFGKKHNVTFYDASYHYLAKLAGFTFVTADEKYFEKVKKVGNIILLKNLKLH
ncbi:type II toxin-antitoxin system VapC family toxin [Patescibacteria group bacterium]|nr:type II toxin-antitoxin system VapC family toxin [Patescibacteria group bacterium]